MTITHASGYIECNSIEKKGVNKYLVFNSTELHSTDENKELLKKYNDVFNGIRNEIKKNKWSWMWLWKRLHENDLPLNKQLKFHNLIINISSVFEEDGKRYP